MPSVQYLREFINERLTAAAEQIFLEFEKTIVQYEEEIDRQRRLLDITWKPQIKLHRTDLPLRLLCREEEVLPEQQLWDQERSSSVEQEEPEPPQIKEQQEELCSSQEGEQLGLEEETDTFTVTATYEESDLSNATHSDSSVFVGTESREAFKVLNNSTQIEKDINHQPRELDVTTSAETDVHRTDLPQQQLRNQDRSSRLDQGEPEPPQIKEQQEELCSSQEGEQLGLEEETDTFTVTATYEESDLSNATHSDSSVFVGTESREAFKVLNNSTQIEKDINHQPRELDVTTSAETDVHRTDLPQQQLRNQDRSSRLDQGEPEPPQRTEEQNKLCSSQEGEQSVVTETKTSTVTPAHSKSDHSESEANRDQLLTHGSAAAESRDQEGGKKGDSDSGNPESKLHVNRSQSNNSEEFPPSASRCNTDTGRKSLQCDICGKSFKKKCQMKEHYKIHTGEKPFTCNTCEKSFAQKSTLLRHMTVHTEERLFSCHICGKTFRQRGNLMIHLRIHTGERPYSCTMCEKTFSQSSHLLGHMRSHRGEKPHQCDHCGKCFSESSSLKLHKVIHTGERPHSCQLCGKTFIKRSNLLRHMRTHTGEKPYVCETCGERFTLSTSLKSHNAIHTGEKPYHCKTCGKMFRQSHHLLFHMKTHNQQKLQC
ncbi:zinc finger protein 260-like isoform X1 [Astatotilapia calliptera]|uniref:zinc finger protein 260-like isoform X1 n=1 Tax=Astatotilapia calliptera TaxID=8154 RepID=UPI000E4034F4|nr:zinc finger protein 260-like isoform X1 [Astatotilapia calliptera]